MDANQEIIIAMMKQGFDGLNQRIDDLKNTQELDTRSLKKELKVLEAKVSVQFKEKSESGINISQMIINLFLALATGIMAYKVL